MKQIIKNQYLKGFKFLSSEEASIFLSSQAAKKCLSIEDSFGEYYYCYVCYHSLTREKLFVLSFSSDEGEENLNFLFWEDQELIVLDTGKNIYLIDKDLNIRASFDISICLVGLYLISENELLVLEEASFKLINSKGQVLMDELFDLIDNFSIEHGRLHLQIGEDNKVFELLSVSN